MIDVAEEMFKISIRKNWSQAVSSPHAKKRSEFTVSGICRLFGVSRQSYYKHNDGLLLRRLAREECVVQFVEEVRQLDPGIGGKKLWLMYHQRFGNQHAVGRDCFYDILDTPII